MTVHPGENIAPLTAVAVAGLTVLGAAFLLAWGAETAEKDVPSAFAIAVLAVAPEYAVDALYAWNAGALEGTAKGAENANLAVTNMTGANRILIGLGWSAIALFTVYRARSHDDPAVEHRDGFLRNVVTLDRDLAIEITFLLAATLFAFVVPLSGATLNGDGAISGIGLLDTVCLSASTWLISPLSSAVMSKRARNTSVSLRTSSRGRKAPDRQRPLFVRLLGHDDIHRG